MPQNKITLLNECVAQEDSYKNGTHQKIANTLHHIIESNNNAITIGLEGDWGSGKSTVINFLEKKFKNNPSDKTLFFKFDAWSHDGDPLRITFLSNLLNEIQNELPKKGSDEEIENKLISILTQVTGKIKTIKSKNTKSSTIFGKLLAISIMMIPIGSALFSKTYSDGPKFIPFEMFNDIMLSDKQFNLSSYTDSFSWYPTLSAFFLFSPILLIFIWLFIGEILDPKHKKWEFISSQSEETIEQNVIEVGDKTSFEFEKLFTQIIDITVGENKPFTKAICVIDNMDRIDSNHVKNIWTTLQVFITNNNQKSNMVWFIIPFDEFAFNKTWPTNKLSSRDDDYVSNSFAEKCFQLIIDVPTPITSEWIHYLTEMSKGAFKQWNEPSLADNFIKQYKDYFSTVNHSPTPRSINNIINQVQALQIRFMNDKNITINAITIYSLLRRTNSKNEIKEMILYPQNSKVNQSILKRIKTFENELSSILFHIPHDKGIELLLQSEISKIINSNDEKQYSKLVSLQAEHGDSFWQAWDSNYQAIDYETSYDNIHKSATLLHVASEYLFEKTNHESLLNYITVIKNEFPTDAYILFKEHGYEKAYNYIRNLFKITKINDKDIETITKIISASINLFVEDKEDSSNISFSSQQSSIDLSSIQKIINSIHIKSIPCDRINSQKAFSIWCEQQNSIGVAIPNILPNESAFGVITSNIFSTNHLDSDPLKKIHDMATLNPSWAGWKNAIDHICNWAKKPTSITQRSAYNSHSNLRSIDNNSMFFSLVQTLNSHSNDSVKAKISELIYDESFKDGLYKEFSDNKKNKSLALLIKPLIDSDEIKLQPEIMEDIRKLYKEVDATYNYEV